MSEAGPPLLFSFACSTRHLIARFLSLNESASGESRYEIGQAGAVGPHSHAHHFTQQQLQTAPLDPHALSEIINELTVLRGHLRTAAPSELEGDIAAGEVAAAQKAALANNPSGLVSALMATGQWVRTLAKELGLKVLTAFIVSSMTQG